MVPAEGGDGGWDDGGGRLEAPSPMMPGGLTFGMASHVDAHVSNAPVRRAKREVSKVLLSYWVDDHQESMRVCDAVEAIGPGRFHLELGVWVGGFLFAEAAELGKASALSHALLEEAGMSQDHHAALISAVFLGFALGNLAAGPVGDYLGRKMCLLSGYAGMLLSSMVICALPVPPVVVIGRISGGFCSGLGIPACFALMAEFTPGGARSLVFCVANLMLSFGVMWVGAWLCLLMPDLKTGDWRTLMMLTDWLPAAVLFVGTFCRVPESPLYLALAGRNEEARNALAVTAARNRQTCPISESARVDAGSSDTLGLLEALPQLFGQRHRVKTAACAYLELSQMMTAFGMAFAAQEAFMELGESSSSSSGSASGLDVPALEFLIVESVNIPATLLSVVLARSSLGHIQLLTLAALVAATGCGLASMLSVSFVVGMCGAMLAKLVLLPWGTTQKVVISEAYHTQLRASALAFTGTVGRLGIIISPLIAHAFGFKFFALLCCTASVLNAVVIRTRAETKGKALEDYDHDDDDDEPGGFASALNVGAAVELSSDAPAKERQGVIVSFRTAADGVEHSVVLLRSGRQVIEETSVLKPLRAAEATQLRAMCTGERVGCAASASCDV